MQSDLRRSAAALTTNAMTDNPTAGPPAKRKRRAIAVSVLERRRLVLEYAKTGASFRAIADRVREELGLPRYAFQQAHEDFKAALQTFRDDLKLEAAHYVALELERLDALTEALWPKAMSGQTPAVAAILRVMERRAKLLGLDAAPDRNAAPHEIVIDWLTDDDRPTPALPSPEL